MLRIKNIRVWLSWLYHLRFLSALLAMGTFHLVLLIHTPTTSHQSIHKFIALLGQVGGATVVFYSINDTLSKFNGSSLSTLFSSWWRQAPWQPPVTIRGYGSFGLSFSTEGIVTVRKKFDNLEERIEYIHDQLDNLDGRFQKARQELKRDIKRIDQQLNEKIDQRMKSLETKLAKNVEEEITPQLFGLMMVFYGAVTAMMG